MKKNYRRSFHWRILVILMAGGVAAITLLTIFWANGLQIQQRHLQMEQLQSSVQTVSNEMYGLVQKQFRTAQILSHSLALRRYVIDYGQHLRSKPLVEVEKMLWNLEKKWRDDPEAFSSIQESLEAQYLKDAIKQSEEIIDRIEVSDGFGVIRVASRRPDDLVLFQENWWQNTLTIRPDSVYSSSHFTRYRGELFWNISIPLRDDSGKDSVGVIQLRLRPEIIFQRALRSYIRKDIRTFIVTADNTIYPSLSENDDISPAFIRQIISRTEPLEMREQRMIRIGIANSPRILQTLVENLDWRVVSIGTYPSILNPANPIFRRSVLFWTMGMIGLLILSVMVSRWITGPLSMLTRAVQQVTAGETGIQLPERGHGEISILSRAFNEMMKRLSESRKQMEKSIIEQSRGLVAIEQFTAETSSTWEYQRISMSLLKVTLQMLNADGGLIAVHRSGGNYEIADKFHLPGEILHFLKPLLENPPDSRQLFFAWQHPDFAPLWENGYQILLSVPVKSANYTAGVLILLFREAPEYDLDSHSLLDILGLLASINFSKSKLYRELRRQKSFVDGLLAGMPSLVFTIDRNMNITWCNRKDGWSWLIAEQSDIIGLKCFSVLKGRDGKCPECPMARTFSEGRTESLNQRVPDRRGNTHWVETTTFPVKNEDGMVTSAILMLRDLTAEQEKEANIQRFSMAIESIAETIIITDLDGRIYYTNRAFERLLGYPVRQVVGNGIDFLMPGDAGEFLQNVQRVTRSKQVWEEEIDLIDRFGKKIRLTMTCSLVEDESGLPSGLVFTGFDMTVRRQKETRLLDRFRDLSLLNDIGILLARDDSIPKILDTVLNRICEFTGAGTGLVILPAGIFRERKTADMHNLEIIASRNPPDIPPYVVRYMEEIRQGRSSSAFEKIIHRKLPFILPDTEVSRLIEAKLIFRMGFRSLVILPIRTEKQTSGFIMMLSQTPFQFAKSQQELFSSVASVISMAFSALVRKERISRTNRHLSRTLDLAAHDISDLLERVLSAGGSGDSDGPPVRGEPTILDGVMEVMTADMTGRTPGISEDSPPERTLALFQHWIDMIHRIPGLETIRIDLDERTDSRKIAIDTGVFFRVMTNLLAAAVILSEADDSRIRIRTGGTTRADGGLITRVGFRSADAGGSATRHIPLDEPGDFFRGVRQLIWSAWNVMEQGNGELHCRHSGETVQFTACFYPSARRK